MGYSKVINKGNGRVEFVHQLDYTTGKPYGETIIVDVPEGVPASRNQWFADQDGKVGVVSLSFSPTTADTSSVKFPEEEKHTEQELKLADELANDPRVKAVLVDHLIKKLKGCDDPNGNCSCKA